MIRLEINASTEELDALIVLLDTDARFSKIKEQVVNARNQNNHHQADEIPAEGDHEYIERSE